MEVADYAKDSERIPLSYAVDEEEFSRSITNQLTDLLWSQKELVTEADKAKAKTDQLSFGQIEKHLGLNLVQVLRHIHISHRSSFPQA